MAPLVSIVLTAYNRADPLRQTLESLVNQTFGDFELLVCDDASIDHTEEVVGQYASRDPRIVYHSNKQNLGMPGNLNAGIRRSRGTYIANLHDGDVYSPTLIEKWAAALERYPKAAFVFNQYRFVDQFGRIKTVEKQDLPPVFSGHHLLEQFYFKRWLLSSPVWGTVMARRETYEKAGLFDPRFGCIADVDMWMRLAETYDVAYISEPLITLPTHEALPRNWTVIPTGPAEKMFWEARMRHFNKRPLRRLGEAARHLGFAAATRAWRGACRLKNRRKLKDASEARRNMTSPARGERQSG